MKQKQDNNIQAFLVLLRAGLWEKECRLSSFNNVDYNVIYRLAQEQSVVGLITAGLEHIIDVKPPKEIMLKFVSDTLQIERHNYAMNSFIGDAFVKLYCEGIHPILVKGQGIAQCYERSLWRASGDVDILLSDKDYSRTVNLFTKLAARIENEEVLNKHLALTIGPWTVELHGTLHSRLWNRIEQELDKIQCQVFDKVLTREWNNGNTIIFLPKEDEDVIFVFAHILQHFFKEGIGMRQICDWSRLLWTYKNSIDKNLLEQRFRRMRLMSEWKAFAYLAVNVLGLPEDSIPFYSSAAKWKRKTKRITEFIIETGNFGHKRDYSFI